MRANRRYDGRFPTIWPHAAQIGSGEGGGREGEAHEGEAREGEAREGEAREGEASRSGANGDARLLQHQGDGTERFGAIAEG